VKYQLSALQAIMTLLMYPGIWCHGVYKQHYPRLRSISLKYTKCTTLPTPWNILRRPRISQEYSAAVYYVNKAVQDKTDRHFPSIIDLVITFQD